MRAPIALLCVAIALVACTSDGDDATRVVVTIDADEPLRTQAASLRLRVDPGGEGTFDQTLAARSFDWPARTTIVPRDGDASRVYVLEAIALDPSGAPLVTARAISGFVPGETRELVIELTSACLGIECAASETCAEGQCVDARIAASSLPRFGETGMDGGVAPGDDGGIDACTPAASYADEDGDGYGDPATLETRCTVPEGRVTRAGDCDDACEACRPEGVEVCDGTRDEDCDGTADEGCACTTGATRACPGASDVGECVAGMQRCVEGTWSVCGDRVDPLPETCDGDDEDCDGRVDEGLQRACEGACGSGTETCRGGEWEGCTVRAPRPETCNGSDDDCDGTTDEGVLTTFYRDADGDTYGAMTATTLACRAPTGYVVRAGDCDDTCRACRPGGRETCDGRLDEDCNGTVDQGCACTAGATRACPGGVDTGECSAGMQTCSGGSWGTCTGAVQATAESCNARDDDCDARVDEGVQRACGPTSDVGVCQRGTQSCSAGAWGTCTGAVAARTESCNALDDDCDGTTDEGVRTTFYADADDDGYGVTSSAIQACTRPSGYATQGGDCDDARPDVRPGATETCDGIDQDCDARVDDGISCMPDAGARDAGVDAGTSMVEVDAGPFP
ncbi:putative metal-binding motif-containing protein [Sandaracinus amylolyticus]|uniref:putative metal-binding motif-containing protein n=1 Tax=Sandaracinus amylolyticus TaxID=927083 RepID=UPI001F325973|nr:putative metal-binding motif-containing protein [Sandaracinus amylolyticus]UJR81861.1 Hypothetical protein I5071_39260 [Sandaracinus amylolyticus]